MGFRPGRSAHDAVFQALDYLNQGYTWVVDLDIEKFFGFRPGRSAHDAVFQALDYLNQGYTWVVDLDIEKFFDMVSHDKLISIIREQVSDKTTLHLLRSFLKAGVMEEGNVSRTVIGTPQGGCISPLLANIYLDKFDKELESRGLKFCRSADDVIIFTKSERIGTPQGGCISPLLANIYLDKFDKELESRGLKFCRSADDVIIFTKSERAANRVMKSISSWLERKLFLKTSPAKTHVCRPSQSQFPGFGFWNSKGEWKARPDNSRKMRLDDKIRKILCRKKAGARPLSALFKKINQAAQGWINYFFIGSMKGFLTKFGQWLRHKIRVIILKQWKRPRIIYKNLMKLCKLIPGGFDPELIRQDS